MKWVFLGISIALVAIVLIYVIIMYVTFRIMLYRPKPPKELVFPKVFLEGAFDKHTPYIKETNKKNEKKPYESVSINTTIGKLKARFFENKDSNKIVIFVHGYYSFGMRDIGYYGTLHEDLNVSLLVVDQRASGESEGKYTSFGAFECYDIREWIFYLDKRYKGEKDIYLHGISMGASTSLLVTSLLDLPESFKGVIADAGYSNANNIILVAGKRIFKIKPNLGFWMVNSFAKLYGGFDLKKINISEELQKNTDIPILFIHGTNDLFVPYEMSVKNYEAAKCAKKLVSFEGAGHCESYLLNKEKYTEELRAFIYGERKL